MRIKPESKSARVAIGGHGFDPGAATALALARRGILSHHQAEHADVHHDGPGLSWFTSAQWTVCVNPGHFDAESRRPPYRPLRDLALGALEEMPDRVMSSIRIDRTFHLAVRNPGRILQALDDRGWISGFGNFLCAVDFQPEKPQGGCLWAFAGLSGLLADAGQRGIRIEISDRYLGGRDPDQSNKLVSEILGNLFHESIRQADTMADRIVADWR